MEAYTIHKLDLMNKILICEDDDGYKWITVVPEYESDCERGAIVGPIEGFSKETHNILAENQYLSATDLLNNRQHLMKLFNNDKRVIRSIVAVYQAAYYGKGEKR